MKRSLDRILTTHVGSLPRPDALVRLMWDRLEDRPFDQQCLDALIADAVREVVNRQVDLGIDIVSDGEMSKIGFSNYVMDRYTVLAGRYTSARPISPISPI